MANFPYPTNYSNGTMVEGVYDFFLGYPQAILNDWFGTGFILLLWVSIFGIMSFSGSARSMTVASFISAIFAIWFAALGMVNPAIIIGLIMLMIVEGIAAKGESGL